MPDATAPAQPKQRRGPRKRTYDDMSPDERARARLAQSDRHMWSPGADGDEVDLQSNGYRSDRWVVYHIRRWANGSLHCSGMYCGYQHPCVHIRMVEAVGGMDAAQALARSRCQQQALAEDRILNPTPRHWRDRIAA